MVLQYYCTYHLLRETESALAYKMLLTFAVLMVTIHWGWCEKGSANPGLKLFREDYKSVEETCLAVGFVRNKCTNTVTMNHRVVAFDARLIHFKRNLTANTRVVFEAVDLNEGLGYSASTGIFTAPSGGIYVFDWTILISEGFTAYTTLFVNNRYKVQSHCDPGTTKIWLACSKMTVVKLDQGDKVWIGVFAGIANIYPRYSSFSGYKL